MRGWKKAIVAIIIVSVVGGSYVAYTRIRGTEDSPSFGEGQIVEVQRGTLLTTVSAFGTIAMPQQAELMFGSSGTVKEINANARFGDVVEKGQLLTQLDTAALERSVAQARASLRTAEINLEIAREPFTAAEIAQTEAAVGSARASLVAAEDALREDQDFLIPDAGAAVRDARVAQDNARRSLLIAEKHGEIGIREAENQVREMEKIYNDFVHANIDILTLTAIAEQRDELRWAVEKARENREIAGLQAANSMGAAENNLIKANDVLRKAEETLSRIQAEPIVIQQRESAVETAQAALARAEENLAEMKAGPDPKDIEMRQIQVDNARLALENAEEQLEEATIVAPFAGVVARVGASTGDRVTAATVVISLVDTSKVEIDAEVDEIDVAQVEAGQVVEITLDAIPGIMLPGKVIAISPIAQMEAGLVTYRVVIEIDGDVGIELREGMSASCEIVVEKREDVLLVPSQAIRRIGRDRVVEVIIGEDETEERVVQVGASVGLQTEILSGLEEGENIVIMVGTDDEERPTPGLIPPTPPPGLMPPRRGGF